MAETLTIGGYQFTKRHPIGVWALGLVTLGIYYVVWWYKINREARDYLGDETIRPGVSVLAVTLGILLLFIPPLVSTYRTGQRIERMQQKAGVADSISPGICLLLLIVSRVDMIYMQEHLNRIWRRYQEAAPQGTAPAGPAAPGGFTG